MQETPISFLQIDTPVGGATLPPGRHAVQGWLMPRLRGGFADLRVSVGDRAFPGLLGFPRSDLAAHFQTGRPRELAGFQANVELAPGPRRLVFEALQIEGTWQEIGALEVAIDGSAPPVDFAVPTAPVRGREFGHLLHALLTEPAPGPDLSPLARRLAASAPFPRDLLRPKPPFFGALVSPEAIEAAPGCFLEVHGHLFHTGSRIRRLAASVDLHALQPLGYGTPSPEIAAKHPRSAAARECGFSGRIFLPSQLPGPVALRLYATLADGSVHLVHVARVQPRCAETLARPFSPKARECFEDGVTALRRAIAERELALVTDTTFQNEVVRLAASLNDPASRPSQGMRILIEKALPQSSSGGRPPWGLPAGGEIVAALTAPGHPAIVPLLMQAESLLRHRHPGLVADCHVVIGETTRSPDGRLLSNEDATALADLIVGPAAPDDKETIGADPVMLAETLARHLVRLRAATPPAQGG